MRLKRLPKFLPFIFCLAFSSAFAQQSIENNTSPNVTYTTYDNGKVVAVKPTTELPHQPKIDLPGCDTLFGSITPTNGFAGIMFRVRATQMTRIDFINCHLSGPGSGYIRLYARFGTWVGHETDIAGWSLVDSVFMNVPATGLYRIPIYIGQVLHVNESGSYYLAFNPNTATAGIEYTDGTTLDSLYSNNATLQLYEGVGHGNLFDACCSPRVFTGTIEHCPAPVNDCQSMPTTLAGGNGNDGAMFDISTNHDIMIRGFAGAVDDTGNVELYYRYGTFVGHEDSASHWIFVDSNFVQSAGAGVATQLFSNLNIPLNAGESMAFYVTGTGPNGVDYTNGTSVGNLFSYDGVVKFYEGFGKGYPFASNNSPRVFNGEIDYCIVPGFIGIDENGEMNTEIEVYPVPTSSELFIDFNGAEGDREIILTDMTGRICARLNNQTSTLVRINVEEFANGIYLYTVINKGRKEASGKFIKQ